MGSDQSSLVERLIDDEEFRNRFRADPSGVASEFGIELSADDAEKLSRVSDSGQVDEELVARVSKRASR